MLNPPEPTFKKSCPVALVVLMFTVTSPLAPACKPHLKVTESPGTIVVSGIPLPVCPALIVTAFPLSSNTSSMSIRAYSLPLIVQNSGAASFSSAPSNLTVL